MAGLIAKGAYRTVRFGVKYVVVPILYTAFLGYLMQEAADRLRHDDGAARPKESPVDHDLHPTR